LEFFRRDPHDFLSRLVTMDETWLYITMIPRQSNNQWSGGIAAPATPKNSKCKNPLEKFSPRFYGIKTASSSLIVFQRSKLVLLISAGKIEGHFEGKTPREVHQGGRVLTRQPTRN
jgi:hypothetical protein